MPVPASFNDITQDSTLRDFVGWVWYDRQVWVPASWQDGKTRIMLRFDSVYYNALVVSTQGHSGTLMDTLGTQHFILCREVVLFRRLYRVE